MHLDLRFRERKFKVEQNISVFLSLRQIEKVIITFTNLFFLKSMHLKMQLLAYQHVSNIQGQSRLSLFATFTNIGQGMGVAELSYNFVHFYFLGFPVALQYTPCMLQTGWTDVIVWQIGFGFWGQSVCRKR